MNKRSFTLFASALLLAALFLTGCKKEETVSTTESASTTTDYGTTGTSGTDTASTDTSATSTSTTSSASATLSQEESDFVMKAAQGGIAEVTLGTTASSKATNADVKTFAQRMVTDHGKANDELKQLAATKGVTLPADTSEEHKKKAADVSAKSGAAFDKAYMSAMVEDHDKDVKEFEEASAKAKDADLKAWIDKTLPVLKDHQKMAHDINGKLK